MFRTVVSAELRKVGVLATVIAGSDASQLHFVAQRRSSRSRPVGPGPGITGRRHGA